MSRTAQLAEFNAEIGCRLAALDRAKPRNPTKCAPGAASPNSVVTPAHEPQYSNSAQSSWNKATSNTTLDLTQPISLTGEEDQETLAALDLGIQAADEGRTVSVDEVRKMIPN